MLTVIMPHWNQSYLDLCNGDTGLMAFHYGKCALYVSVLEMFCSPVVAALSDTFGRVHFATWGRLGWIIFFSGHAIRDRSLPHRALFEAVPWGIIQAGVWPVFAAAHSDVFGTRPALSGRIKARDSMYCDAAGFCGPMLSYAVARVFGLASTEHLSSLLTLASMGVLLTVPETLAKANRKPFRLATSNPLSNVWLLLSNGPGLRRLALSTSLWFWVQEIWSTQSAFRMGVLRWTPVEQSVFDSGYNGLGTIVQGPVVQPLLARLGNRRAYQYGALISGVAYLVQSQAHRPAGAAGKLRMAVQYCLGIGLLKTLPDVMGTSMRAMMVSQGIKVCDVGRGQINAAYGGLGQITAVFSALFWGSLYRFFSDAKLARGRASWLQWGPGGHFVLAAGAMVAAWWLLVRSKSGTLFLDDDDAAAEGGREEGDANKTAVCL
jgi:hypothetical protein